MDENYTPESIKIESLKNVFLTSIEAETLELIKKVAEKIDGAKEIKIFSDSPVHMIISAKWDDGYIFSQRHTKAMMNDCPSELVVEMLSSRINHERKMHLKHAKTV